MAKFLNNSLIYNSPIVADNVLWAASVLGNGLYKMSPDLRKCEFMGFFPDESFGENFLYSGGTACDELLLFVPFSGKSLAIYDVYNNRFETLELPHYKTGLTSLFFKCISDEDKVYLIPCRYEYIVELDMRTRRLKEYPIFEESGKNRWDCGDSPFLFKGGCKSGDIIYLGCGTKNFIELIDIKNMKRRYMDIPYELNGISNMEIYKNSVLIVGRNGRMVKWEPEDDSFECFYLSDAPDPGHYGVYFESLIHNDILYLTGTNSRTIMKFSCNTNEFEAINLPKTEVYGRFREFPYDVMAIYEWEGNVRVLDAWNGKCYELSEGYGNNEFHILSPVNEEDIDCEKYLEGRSLHLSSFLDDIICGRKMVKISYE